MALIPVVAAALLLLLAASPRRAAACTAIAVAPGATAERCAYTGTSSDCKDCDFRLALVPGATHAPRARRPVYLVRFTYPHQVGARAATWHRRNLEGSAGQLRAWRETEPMGFVPQVRRTFALYESGSGYGLVNEHQVSIGESTCPGATVAAPRAAGGRALFDVSELSRLALERATSARAAIAIMGAHAEQYGYYGAEWDLPTRHAEAGEALTVADQREAWVFHIVADDSGASAVWAAQRVPDGHIAAVANAFVIRNVVFDDPRNFMYSSNIRSVARRLGLWNPPSADAPLDFATVYGVQQPHSSYVTLRLWRIFTVADPRLLAVLNATTESDQPGYPFSVRPLRALSARGLMALYRDHFEGTPYDLTQGPAAGAYGDPDRYDVEAVDGMSLTEARRGEFARSISLFRTSYVSVARACAALPREAGALLYFAQNQPASSAFVPLYVHGAAVPDAFSRGSLFRFSARSFFWQVALASNWAHRYHAHAMPAVRAAQADAERYDVAATDRTAAELVAAGRVQDARALLRDFSQVAAANAFRRYARLFPELVARFHDGYALADQDAPDINITSFFYPRGWLTRVGYFDAAETAPAKGAEALRMGAALARGAKALAVRDTHRGAAHAVQQRQLLESRITDNRFEETAILSNFVSGVVVGAALCFGLVYTLTDLLKVRRGYAPIQE